MKKRKLTVDQVADMVIGLSDDIYGAYQNRKGEPRALNFYVKAYDNAYIWSGLYESQEALERALDNDCGSCSTYIYYFPKTKKVILSVEDVDYLSYEFLICKSEGKDLLIRLCEEYCNEMLSVSCKEALKKCLVV